MKKKLNVLQFICPAGLYGAEMWILALSKNLKIKSVNCSLAVSLESETQNIEVFNRFRSLGMPAYTIKMHGKFDPAAIRKLVKLIREKKIDVLHTHGYKSDILGLIAARVAGIKVLATPHGFENSKDLKLRFFIYMGCMSLKCCDSIAPLSEELLSDMQKIGVNSSKIRLIMNGVDLDEIESINQNKSSHSIMKRKFKNIGYVGQMAYRKNVADLIRTFDSLYKTYKNIRLLLIGDGPMKDELEKMAGKMASSSQIKFLGYRTDRLEIVKGLDLFSMTSSLEGIPRCMMEAMALGTPVAAYNIPGVDKLILNEQTGLMADLGDVEGLKKCWQRLLFNDGFAERIAKNGRDYILEKYSAGRMADEYLELYEEILR
jgi:glycosyltransferase involved in cell wall biosynthesis